MEVALLLFAIVVKINFQSFSAIFIQTNAVRITLCSMLSTSSRDLQAQFVQPFCVPQVHQPESRELHHRSFPELELATMLEALPETKRSSPLGLEAL